MSALAAARALLASLPNHLPPSKHEPPRQRSKIRRGRRYVDNDAVFEAAMSDLYVAEEKEQRRAEGRDASSSIDLFDDSELEILERRREHQLKYDLIKQKIAVQQKRVDAEMARMPDFNPAHDELPTFRLSTSSAGSAETTESLWVEGTRRESRDVCADLSNVSQLSQLGSPITGNAKHVVPRHARFSTVSDISHLKDADRIKASTPIKMHRISDQNRSDDQQDEVCASENVTVSNEEGDRENREPVQEPIVAHEQDEPQQAKCAPKTPASATKPKEKTPAVEKKGSVDVQSPISKRFKGRSPLVQPSPPATSSSARPKTMTNSKFVGTPRPTASPRSRPTLLRAALHQAAAQAHTSRFAPVTPRVNSTLLIAQAPPRSGTGRRARPSTMAGVVKDSLEPVRISFEGVDDENSNSGSDQNGNKTDGAMQSLNKSSPGSLDDSRPSEKSSVAGNQDSDSCDLEVTTPDGGVGMSLCHCSSEDTSTIPSAQWDADSSVFTTGTPGDRGRLSTDSADNFNNSALDDTLGRAGQPSASFIARRPSLFQEPIVCITAAPKEKASPVMVLMKPKLKLPEAEPGLRRSQRVKVPRLQTHLNQHIVYKTLSDGTREVASISDVVIKDKEMKKYRTGDLNKVAIERQREQRISKNRNEQKLAHNLEQQQKVEKRAVLRQRHKKGFNLTQSSDDSLMEGVGNISLLDDDN